MENNNYALSRAQMSNKAPHTPVRVVDGAGQIVARIEAATPAPAWPIYSRRRQIAPAADLPIAIERDVRAHSTSWSMPVIW